MSQGNSFSFPSTQPEEEIDLPEFPPNSWGCLEQISPMQKPKKYHYFIKEEQLLCRVIDPKVLTQKEIKEWGIHELPHPTVSRRHALIKLNSEEQDLQPHITIFALNGHTTVGGTALPKNHGAPLDDGTVIGITSTFCFVLHIKDSKSRFNPWMINNRTYQVLSQLGRGAQGTVWRASNCETAKTVAIKEIQYLATLDDKISMSVYEREISTLKGLSHPNIVKLLDSEFQTIDKPHFYLVLEFVGGGTLKEFIDARKSGLEESEAKAFTQQILQAVEHLHSVGIAHRDLKPANILVTRESPPRIKVSDFGLAKYFGDGSCLKTALGTPLFAAPEIYQAARGPPGRNPTPPMIMKGGVYGTAIDCWSVGIMLFVMLSGSHKVYKFPVNKPIDPLPSRKYLRMELIHGLPLSSECIHMINILVVDEPSRRTTAMNALTRSWFQ